jgi:SAM-dependent methyltransferase
LCHSQKLFTKFGSLVGCNQCGIVFEDIDYMVFNPEEIYTDGYFQGKVYSDYVGEEARRREIFKKKFSLIQGVIKEGDVVLDVGCATGGFLKVLEYNRVFGYGVEISDFAAGYAREKNFLRVITGDLIGVEFPSTFFDAVTMWDVLEHLPNPLEVLKDIYRILKPKGFLIIETLNIDSWNARIMKDQWPLYSPPYHLFYYSARTLEGILQSCGFRPIAIIPINMYIRTLHGYRKINLYKNFLLKRLLGKFFSDVIIFAAVKV